MDYEDRFNDYENQYDEVDRFELVEVNFQKVTRETDLAYQLELSDDPFEQNRIWLPKSQISGFMEEKRIFIPQWLAEEKGLV